MLTIVTETAVRKGRESDWDEAYHERAVDARARRSRRRADLVFAGRSPLPDASSVPGGAVVVDRDEQTWRRPTVRGRSRRAGSICTAEEKTSA